MKHNSIALIIAIVASMSPGFAQAQDTAATPAPGITLQVEGGQVMTSDGGEFATASSGSTVAAGSRVMVAEGGSARLDYGNGCSMQLSKPGVHFVPAACSVAASAPSRPANTGLIVAGVAVGVAAIAAAGGGGGGDDDDPPPVSR